MFVKQDFNLIVTVVARGFSDNVMEAAKNAGAEGATIINARGNGIHENDTVLGVSIQPEKEVVMILVRKTIRKKVMREICKHCGLGEEGKGICFSLPVDEMSGVSHLLGVKKPNAKTPVKQTAKPAHKETKSSKTEEQTESLTQKQTQEAKTQQNAKPE